MKRFTLNGLMTLSVLLLVACSASAPKISSDYDPSIDFSQYKTYNFYNPMSIESRGYQSIIGQYFRTAISRQMDQRGYVLSDDPQLMMNVSATLEDKTKVTTYNEPFYPGYYGGYYGYRRGFYDPWMGYGGSSSTHVSQYTEGTVNIDMVDIELKRMIWEGVAVGRVDEDRTNDELRAAINAGVAEMFANYPFRAAD